MYQLRRSKCAEDGRCGPGRLLSRGLQRLARHGDDGWPGPELLRMIDNLFHLLQGNLRARAATARRQQLEVLLQCAAV